jgi:hypothetical protein
MTSREKELMETKFLKSGALMDTEESSGALVDTEESCEDFIDDSSEHTSSITFDERVPPKKLGRPIKWHYVSRREQGTVGKRYKRLIQFIGTEALLAFQEDKLDALDYRILEKIAVGGFDEAFLLASGDAEKKKVWESVDALMEMVDAWGNLKEKPLIVEKQNLIDLVKIAAKKSTASSNKISEEKAIHLVRDFVENKGTLTKSRKTDEEKRVLKENKDKKKQEKEEEKRVLKENKDEKKQEKEEEKRVLKENKDEKKQEKEKKKNDEDAEATFEEEVPKETVIREKILPVNTPKRPIFPTSLFLQDHSGGNNTSPENSTISMETFASEINNINCAGEENKTILFAELNPEYFITLASMKELQNSRMQNYISDTNYQERFSMLVTKLVSFKVVLCGRKLDSNNQSSNESDFLSYFQCLYKLLKRTKHNIGERPERIISDDAIETNNDLLDLIEKDLLFFTGIVEKCEKDNSFFCNDFGEINKISDIKLCVQRLEHAQKLIRRSSTYENANDSWEIEDFYFHFTKSFIVPTMYFITEEEHTINWVLKCVFQQPNQKSYFDWNILFESFSNNIQNAFCFKNKRYMCLELEDVAKEIEYIQTAFSMLCSQIERLVQRLELKGVGFSVLESTARKIIQQRNGTAINPFSVKCKGSTMRKKLKILKDLIEKAVVLPPLTSQQSSSANDLLAATEIIDELMSQEVYDDDNEDDYHNK